ncbi:hypothetical protein N658DRAFT_81903, partial [Parathielavia hyrcaniae]
TGTTVASSVSNSSARLSVPLDIACCEPFGFTEPHPVVKFNLQESLSVVWDRDSSQLAISSKSRNLGGKARAHSSMAY